MSSLGDLVVALALAAVAVALAKGKSPTVWIAGWLSPPKKKRKGKKQRDQH